MMEIGLSEHVVWKRKI